MQAATQSNATLAATTTGPRQPPVPYAAYEDDVDDKERLCRNGEQCIGDWNDYNQKSGHFKAITPVLGRFGGIDKKEEAKSRRKAKRMKLCCDCFKLRFSQTGSANLPADGAGEQSTLATSTTTGAQDGHIGDLSNAPPQDGSSKGLKRSVQDESTQCKRVKFAHQLSQALGSRPHTDGHNTAPEKACAKACPTRTIPLPKSPLALPRASNDDQTVVEEAVVSAFQRADCNSVSSLSHSLIELHAQAMICEVDLSLPFLSDAERLQVKADRARALQLASCLEPALTALLQQPLVPGVSAGFACCVYLAFAHVYAVQSQEKTRTGMSYIGFAVGYFMESVRVPSTKARSLAQDLLSCLNLLVAVESGETGSKESYTSTVLTLFGSMPLITGSEASK